MKTEQEIRQMVNTCKQYHSCAACPYNPEDISRFIGDRWKGGCPNYDRQLVYAMGKGYGDVSEYKAEIERLRQEVRDTDKMARNTIEQYKNDYDKTFERLKAQQREIERLKAENCELTKKLEARLTCDFVKTAQKQAQINVLNKLKDSYGLYYLSAFGVKERMLADILNPMIEELKK